MSSFTVIILERLASNCNLEPENSFSQMFYAELAESDHFYKPEGGGLGKKFSSIKNGKRDPLIAKAFEFNEASALPVDDVGWVGFPASVKIADVEALASLASVFESKTGNHFWNKQIYKAARCLALVCEQTMTDKTKSDLFNRSLEKLNTMYSGNGLLAKDKESVEVLQLIKAIKTRYAAMNLQQEAVVPTPG